MSTMVGCGCDNENHCSMAYTFNLQVDEPRRLCLKEPRPDSLQDVLRPWDKCLDTSLPALRSDVDELHLLYILFISPVKIVAISAREPAAWATPKG